MNLGLAYLKHLQKRYCTGTTRNIIYCDPELMLRIREYIESCFDGKQLRYGKPFMR